MFQLLLRAFDDSLLDPAAAQASALSRLVAILGASGVGAISGLDRVRRPEDARGLPQTDYQSLAALIKVARDEGKSSGSIFGRSELVAFGQTSGTTAEPKRIPITRDYIRSYRRATRIMSLGYLRSTGFREAYGGRTLALAARPFVENGPGGLPEGFVSGLMAVSLPWYLKRRVLPGRRLLSIPSWDDKMDLVLELARRHDIRRIAGVPSLVLSVSERAAERFGVRALNEIWPALTTLFSGGVGLSEPLKDRFRVLWGRDDLNFWEMYAATEGQFGHTLSPTLPGMVFNALENFYQFQETAGGPFLQLHELKEGGRYLIHVTTPGGLINYRMGDWVEITGSRPLTFRISGREKDEISIATEKIIPDQLEKAMEVARVALGIPLNEFAVWSEPGSPNRLVWAVEKESLDRLGGVGPDSRLGLLLDQALAGINPSYAEFRRENFLYGDPIILAVEAAAFKNYRNKNLDRGQFKAKRIFADRAAFDSAVALGPGRGFRQGEQ